MLVALAAVGVVAAAASGSALLFASPAAAPAATSKVPPREITFYGHIKSLTRKGGRFEMRFDHALWLQGITAQRAAVEDKQLRPGEPVPNDYYIRDETHRLLTYAVTASAQVSVVTRAPRSTAITVSELAHIVRGENPRHRLLYGSKLGFGIRIRMDTVRSLDQQYQP